MKVLLKYLLIAFFLNGSVKSVRLQCGLGEQRGLEYCSVDTLKVPENDIEVTEVSIDFNFNPQVKTNDDIEMFRIHEEAETERVPTKVCNFFKNIKRYDIWGIRIIWIHRDVFTNCKKVQEVLVTYSDLTTLPEDLFVDLTELKELIIQRNNKLITLPADLFVENSKLQKLWVMNNDKLSRIETELPSTLNLIVFSGNICIDKIFPQDIADFKLFNDEVISNCGSSMKKSYQSKVITIEKSLSNKEKEIVELKRQKEAKATNITQTTESEIVNELFASSDGNLNTATKFLMSSNALQSCGSKEVINRFDKEEKIELKCKSSEKTFCAVTDFKVQFDNTRIEKFSNGMSDSREIKSLTISKQQTFFLPMNLGEVLPYLVFLVVTDSGLFSIENSCLTGFKNLQTLILKGNKIHEISWKALAAVGTLKELDLSMNRIEKLRAATFRSLTNLQLLNLSGNKLKLISSNLLHSLKSIEKADLTNNDCIDISFPETTKEMIEKSIIGKCVLSVQLNCGKETEEQIEKDDIISYKDSDISSLEVVDQLMNFIPSKLSKMFPNLQIIVIKNSKLISLRRKDFPGLNRLKKIEITGNNLSSIEKGTFEELTELEVLDLSSNEIVSLPSKIFCYLENLKKLILSLNRIKQFTADLLPTKGSIVELRINGNLLEMIEAKMLRLLRISKVIDFSNNTCIDERYEKADIYGISFSDLSGHIKSLCVSICDIFNCS